MEQDSIDLHFKVISEKLDAHGRIFDEYRCDLKQIRDDMSVIAVQSTQIAILQGMQNEMRGDLNDMKDRMSELKNWQASCPRSNITRMWAFMAAIVMSFAGAFVAHIFSGGIK